MVCSGKTIVGQWMVNYPVLRVIDWYASTKQICGVIRMIQIVLASGYTTLHIGECTTISSWFMATF